MKRNRMHFHNNPETCPGTSSDEANDVTTYRDGNKFVYDCHFLLLPLVMCVMLCLFEVREWTVICMKSFIRLPCFFVAEYYVAKSSMQLRHLLENLYLVQNILTQ